MVEIRSIEEKRDEVLSLFRDALETKLVRWTDELTSAGDFEGRDLTLEIFDIPVGEQRETHRRLRELRHRSEQILGSAILLVFHTPEATRSHYAGLVETRARIAKSVLMAPLSLRLVSGSLSGHFETRIEGRPRFAFPHAA
jgi:hypothetical protein